MIIEESRKMGERENKRTPPFLSVCIPTHNRAKLLSKAIQSVLGQDFTNFELIICDNASTDNTEQVVAKYDDARIRYVRYSQLVSMYANHNRCLEIASAEWIAFLHSDDELIDLSFVVQTINQLDDMIACFPFPESNSGNINRYKKHSFMDLLRLLNGISPSGAIYHKRSVKDQGGFAEDNIIADWEILLDLANSGSVYSYCGEPFVSRLNHDGQAYHKSIKDGSAHFGKLHCIKRVFSRINLETFRLMSVSISTQWSKTEITKFCFYLYGAGFVEHFKILQNLASNNGKYEYFSSSEMYRLLIAIFKEEGFFSIYKYLRSVV